MEARQKHIVFFVSAMLVIATLVAYEPIRHNGFVNYDDDSYITHNSQVTSGITLQSLWQAFTKPHFFMWHPLTTISHMIDYNFFGLKPLGHHLVSVLIHIANALLLFLILNNITGSLWASAFTAAVFTLHPVQVESVAWAAERKTVLSGFFWLLTMAAYINYTRRPGLLRYILLLSTYGLCIMTKPVVVTLPLTLLVLDYWPLERIGGLRAEDRGRKSASRMSVGWLIIEKIPLMVLSILLSAITFISQIQSGAVPTLQKMPMDYRIANTFLSYIRYIGKTIWPSKLAAFYPHSKAVLSDYRVVICAVLFILITALSIYIGRRKKYAAVGWLWYAVTLIPVIGLVQAGSQAMANRYMYMPILGLLIIIGWSAKEYLIERPQLKIAFTFAAISVLSACIISTRIEVGHWQNNLTLFKHTLNITENNIMAEINYGMALLEADSPKEAIEHFNNALRINKNHVNAYLNLGIAYNRLGRTDMATKNFTKALELKPDSINSLNNLAVALATADDASLRDANKAIYYARRACELTDSKDAVYLDTLAMTYNSAGKFEEANAAAKKALSIAKTRGQEKLAAEIEKRLKSYEAQSYREK